MQINGKRIQSEKQQKLKERIQKRGITPRLDLVYAGNDSVIETFMRLKKEFGETIGARVVMHTFTGDTKEERIAEVLNTLANSSAVDGIVVQLPLPERFNRQKLLDAVPREKDVDMLSAAARDAFKEGEGSALPPVVGAIASVFERHDIALANKSVAVVGQGELVGEPVSVWLKQRGVKPAIFEEGDDLAELTEYDVVISGAGDPHIIRPEHIKAGAVLIDAGTSESDAGTKGDIDPACGQKASLAALVPGGIGPITVAMIFENLLTLLE